jgi:hypothetical protein
MRHARQTSQGRRLRAPELSSVRIAASEGEHVIRELIECRVKESTHRYDANSVREPPNILMIGRCTLHDLLDR